MFLLNSTLCENLLLYLAILLKAISFKNELEKLFLQKFADHCSQQKFVYQIRATILKAILICYKQKQIVIITNSYYY